mgnify:CR=1 FL=1
MKKFLQSIAEKSPVGVHLDQNNYRDWFQDKTTHKVMLHDE